MKTFDTYLGLSEKEVFLLHSILGNIDKHLLAHILKDTEFADCDTPIEFFSVYRKLDDEVKSLESEE